MLVRVKPYRNLIYGGISYWEGDEFDVKEEEKLNFFIEADLVELVRRRPDVVVEGSKDEEEEFEEEKPEERIVGGKRKKRK